MGRTFASELSNIKEEIGLQVAIETHLVYNHYPPLPVVLVNTAIAAIELANCDLWEEHVDLPEGITWKGKNSAPVYACIEEWHLDCFLQYDEDE